MKFFKNIKFGLKTLFQLLLVVLGVLFLLWLLSIFMLTCTSFENHDNTPGAFKKEKHSKTNTLIPIPYEFVNIPNFKIGNTHNQYSPLVVEDEFQFQRTILRNNKYFNSVELMKDNASFIIGLTYYNNNSDKDTINYNQNLNDIINLLNKYYKFQCIVQQSNYYSIKTYKLYYRFIWKFNERFNFWGFYNEFDEVVIEVSCFNKEFGIYPNNIKDYYLRFSLNVDNSTYNSTDSLIDIKSIPNLRLN